MIYILHGKGIMDIHRLGIRDIYIKIKIDTGYHSLTRMTRYLTLEHVSPTRLIKYLQIQQLFIARSVREYPLPGLLNLRYVGMTNFFPFAYLSVPIFVSMSVIMFVYIVMYTVIMFVYIAMYTVLVALFILISYKSIDHTHTYYNKTCATIMITVTCTCIPFVILFNAMSVHKFVPILILNCIANNNHYAFTYSITTVPSNSIIIINDYMYLLYSILISHILCHGNFVLIYILCPKSCINVICARYFISNLTHLLEGYHHYYYFYLYIDVF